MMPIIVSNHLVQSSCEQRSLRCQLRVGIMHLCSLRTGTMRFWVARYRLEWCSPFAASSLCALCACCGASLFGFCFEFFFAFWRGDSEQVLVRFGAGCFRFGAVVFCRSSEEIFVRQNGEDLLHWSWLCRGSDDGNDRLEVS